MTSLLFAVLDVRGYVVLYHPAETNRCPGCGGAQWHVGRSTAECAVCSTALPLAQLRAPSEPVITVHAREN